MNRVVLAAVLVFMSASVTNAGMHHTNVDLYERVREQDLKQNAVVMAWFAWQAATTGERIPRP